MVTLVIVLAVAFLLAGLGRLFYKGQYKTLGNFLLTLFFLDMVFDDWGGDSDVSDIDF